MTAAYAFENNEDDGWDAAISTPAPTDVQLDGDLEDCEAIELPTIGPVLSDDALHGIAGVIVRKLLPNTEAHPAGLLVDMLLRFGNIVGRTAYYQVEGTQHYPVLDAVRVGATSKARKGTSGDRITQLYADVSKSWSNRCCHSGLSTGEGIVAAVHDTYAKADGESVEGIKDKRLFIYESEFAGPLTVMQRDGNTLSRTVRDTYDGKVIETMTKSNPLTATGAHVSIMGDITVVELKKLLTNKELFNGFANRFLWVHVHRTKKLAFGGKDIDWTAEQSTLRDAYDNSKRLKRMLFDRNARLMWKRFYDELLDREGVLGAITARGEAQVVRLALIYALLDKAECINTQHLKAALAVWKYCDESVRYIFGNNLTDRQTKILTWLLEQKQLGKPPQNKRAITRGALAGRGNVAELAADLVALTAGKYIDTIGGEDGEVYQATGKRLEQ